MAHKHAYQRLSDDAVFCRDCGEIKRAEPPVCALPHYPVYPYVAPIIWPRPYVQPFTPYVQPWWGTTTITSGSVTVDGTATTYPEGSSVTYTAESPS